MMRRLTLALPLLALAACAGGSNTTAPATVTVTQTVAQTFASPIPGDAPSLEPANPVPIAKKIPGCKLEDGAVSGQRDMLGGRYVSCRMGEYVDVTVRTYSTPDLPDTAELKPDDSHVVVVGEQWTVVFTGQPAELARVNAKGIGAALGGTIKS